ncbi:MAG: YfcC family protein [Chloroflexales bacterium]|nr:YfcC family protein [Chloroflexales bacterium]
MAAITSAAPKKRHFTFPSAYTILALLIIVVAGLTFFIPAGRYELDANGAPIPGSYQRVDPNPQRLRDAVLAPIDGMYGIQAEDGSVDPYNTGSLYGAIDVALFILIIGGFLGIAMKTGAIDAGIAALVERLGTKARWLIIALMGVFAAGGTSYGMAEESLAFYVLIISAIIALGYDALTGVAVLMLGAGIGVIGSTVNPFATGIASGFAGIPLGEGIAYRIIILVAGTALGVWWVLRYARRVREEPSRSLVANMKEENEQHFLHKEGGAAQPVLDSKRKRILGLFVLAFLIMIYSVIPWSDLGLPIPTLGWWFPELGALFLVFAIIIGLVARMGEIELIDNFIDGARDLLGVALVVGLARGISVIMNNGLIIDTVLHAMEQSLGNLAPVPFINGVFLVYLPLSFLIPSSSGLATVTMPIMAPLGDFAGVPKHLIVTAYQSASGLLNLFTPTFAVVTGGLAIGRVPIATWWRFILPLVGMLAVLIMAVLTVGVLIGA